MSKDELKLIRWFEETVQARRSTGGKGAREHVPIEVGDDMAGLQLSDGQVVLLGTDMIVDGTHFDSKTHRPEQIGRKAICCCLSDAAAMAARPLAALVSLALPQGTMLDTGRELLTGMMTAAEEFDCEIIGGDTVRWAGGLAVDIALIAQPWPECRPITRRGALPDDRLFVTGALGGSLLGRHLTFAPRVHEARALAETLGADLHAMIDISDGLSLDLHRLCTASHCGASIRESLLRDVLSPNAHKAAELDGRAALQHALSDGEDFELLFAASPGAESMLRSMDFALHPIGRVTHGGVVLVRDGGEQTDLEPEGFEH